MRSVVTYVTASVVGVSILLMASNLAAQEVAEIPFFSASPGAAALGGGLRLGQSPYLASDSEDERRVDLVPLYLYEGKYLFARGTSGGIHFVKSDGFELNLYTRYRFQKLDPDSNVFYEGLEERKQTLDAGIELGIRRGWGEIKLDWVTDTLDRHDGQEVLPIRDATLMLDEVALRVQKPALEIQLGMTFDFR